MRPRQATEIHTPADPSQLVGEAKLKQLPRRAGCVGQGGGRAGGLQLCHSQHCLVYAARLPKPDALVKAVVNEAYHQVAAHTILLQHQLLRLGGSW